MSNRDDLDSGNFLDDDDEDDELLAALDNLPSRKSGGKGKAEEGPGTKGLEAGDSIVRVISPDPEVSFSLPGAAETSIVSSDFATSVSPPPPLPLENVNTAVNSNTTPPDIFDDDLYDDLLSQIDEEGFSQPQPIPTPTTPEIPSVAVSDQITITNLNHRTDMPPPKIIPPIRPPQKNTGVESPSTSSRLNLSFPKKKDNVSSTREAFFANWDTDEATSFEKRLKSMKRRFPGPAGLLPVISPSQARLLTNADHPLSQCISKIIATDLYRIQNGDEQNENQGQSKNDQNKNESALAKNLNFDQMTNQDREILRMNKGPWRELLKVLKLDPDDPQGPLRLMNIRWISKKITRMPVTTRIPFLAFVVEDEPEILGAKGSKKKNPSIKLMDSTGSIVAAMDAAFVETFGLELSPGTAIAVKNAGFLRFKRQIILTVTRRNIICMTSTKKDVNTSGEKKLKFVASKTRKNLPPGASPAKANNENENAPQITETKDGIKILKFCEFSIERVMADYERIMSDNLSISVVEEQNQNQPRNDGGGGNNSNSLFSTVRRPASVSLARFARVSPPGNNNICSPVVGGIETGQYPQNARTIMTAPPATITSPSANPNSMQSELDSASMFEDDDDDELMQALDAVDFSMETDDNSSSNFL